MNIKKPSPIVVFVILFAFLSSMIVCVASDDNFVGEIRYDFIENTELFYPYKESGSTSILNAVDDCLKVDYTISVSGAAAGFVSNKVIIDRSVHNYINFKIKVPANVSRFRIFMLNTDGSVYTSWDNAENGMTNIAQDGEFHIYTIDLDNANIHATRPKEVADGTYSIRFDIMMNGTTGETQSAYLDWFEISQDSYSSKPTFITGVQVNNMTFDINVGEHGYTLCEDTAAYLTLDCSATTIGANLKDNNSTVVSNVKSLTNHKILDIIVTNSNNITASYRFVFATYQKTDVSDLRWDFMNDFDTEGWESNHQLTCPIKVEDGKLNASTTTVRDAYFSIALDNVDIFDSYRYIHFKAKNMSSTNSQLQVYIKSGNYLHKNVTVQKNESGYKIYTLDLHEFVNGSDISLIEDNLCTLLRFDFYNVGSSVTTIDGNLDLDWIVLSQNADVPKAPASIANEEITYSVVENGRYRLLGTMTSTSIGGDGAEVKIYHNSKLLYQCYFPDGKSGMVDVRVLAKAGDAIKTKLVLTGDNDSPFMEWGQEVTLDNTVKPHNLNDTTLGENCSTINETLLSSYLGENKPDDVKIYTTLYGVKHYLEWNTNNSRWLLTEPYVRRDNINASDGREQLEDMVWQNAVVDNNYVSETQIRTSSNPTSNATTYIEIPVETSGIIKVDGNFVVTEDGFNVDGEPIILDGELIKVYVNDKLIWSNRIGGEVSTRYDEPYDTKYFINTINAVATVKSGDILKFTFNRWRHNYDNEFIDVSDIKIKYVENNILSDSTVWKLKNSIVADISTNQIYINGDKKEEQMQETEDDVLISLDTALELFANDSITSNDGYVPLYETAKLLGKNPVWITDNLLVIQDCAISMFTWNEISEIIAEVERYAIPETQATSFYSNGEEIKYLAAVTQNTDIVAKTQTVIGTVENPVSVIPIIALYNNSSMVRCCIGEQMNNLDGKMSEIQVSLNNYSYAQGDNIKVFYWENLQTLKPMLIVHEIK